MNPSPEALQALREAQARLYLSAWENVKKERATRSLGKGEEPGRSKVEAGRDAAGV